MVRKVYGRAFEGINCRKVQTNPKVWVQLAPDKAIEENQDEQRPMTKIALLILLAILLGLLALLGCGKNTPNKGKPFVDVAKTKPVVRLYFDSKDDAELYKKWLKEGSLRELTP